MPIFRKERIADSNSSSETIPMVKISVRYTNYVTFYSYLGSNDFHSNSLARQDMVTFKLRSFWSWTCSLLYRLYEIFTIYIFSEEESESDILFNKAETIFCNSVSLFPAGIKYTTK